MEGDVMDHTRTLADATIGRLAFGCWRMTDPDVGKNAVLVEHAVDLGMNLIDQADVYGFDWGGRGFGTCEEMLGRVFASRPGLRERVVLATKGGIRPGVPYDSTAAYLVEACEGSLRRLGVDVVDLYQIHRPDVFAHPAEVAQAMTSLRERGLVREFGVSNYTVSQTRALQAHVPFALISTQPEYSVTHLEPLQDGTLDLCLETGLVTLAWSPLAGGRVMRGESMRAELIETLDELALREGVGRDAIAVAFVLHHPSQPVAIVGSQNPDHLRSIAAALDVTLSRSDLYRLIEASTGERLP
jgi:predicted oxidoreductase